MLINKRQFALQSFTSFPQCKYRNSTVWLLSLLRFQARGSDSAPKAKNCVEVYICVTCIANFLKPIYSILVISVLYSFRLGYLNVVESNSQFQQAASHSLYTLGPAPLTQHCHKYGSGQSSLHRCRSLIRKCKY